MATSLSYSAGFVVLMLASLLVLAQNNDTNPCLGKTDCKACVVTTYAVNKTCTFFNTVAGPACMEDAGPSEGEPSRAINVADCDKLPSTTAATTTTTTPVPPATTNATTTATTTTLSPPTTTNATTTPTTPSTTQITTPTTTASPNTTTTASPVPTTSTTTASPNSTTTAVPTPKSGGGMSVASFFGGIVFTLGVSAVGYLIFRFYKQRIDRNYHTFSNPSF